MTCHQTGGKLCLVLCVCGIYRESKWIQYEEKTLVVIVTTTEKSKMNICYES